MAHAIWPWLFPVNANATPALTVVAIACFSLVLLRYLVRPSRSRLPLPPGPKPLPIIDNLLDFPEHYEWVTYDRWRKKYGKYQHSLLVLHLLTLLRIIGDVVYVESLGQSIVILGSWAAVSDLLDRRSAIYSDRGRAVMVVEL